jgi:zinc protease
VAVYTHVPAGRAAIPARGFLAGLALAMLMAMSLIAISSCAAGSPAERPSPSAASPGSSDSSEGGFRLPVPETFQLDGGLEVWLLRAEQVPLVNLALVVQAGAVEDPPGKEGLAALTATMLDEGAGARKALEIADAIDFLGAQLAIAARREYTQISLETLARNLDPALDILADVALRPNFEQAEWDRVKRLWLNDLAQRREEPQQVVHVVADRVFYGDGHPYAHPDSGYQESVAKIELEDVKSFYARHYHPRRAVLLVVGNFTPDSLREHLAPRFETWEAPTGAPSPGPREVPPRPASKLRLIVVDKPGAPQTAVRVHVPTPAFGAGSFAPLTLANIVFGGTFSSRLMTNLREKNRFTYGARSAVASRRAPGHLVAAAAVNAQKTLPALLEFCREFRAMETGELGAGEIEKARLTHRRRMIQALETQSGFLNFYVESAARGEAPGRLREFHERVLSSPADEIRAAATEYFLWERALVVAVGDRQLIEGQLNEWRAAREEEPGKGAEGEAGDAGCSVPPPEFRDREGAPLPAEPGG